jgi:hypothetical protein
MLTDSFGFGPRGAPSRTWFTPAFSTFSICEMQSSATALAAIAKSTREGSLKKDETVCAIATGSGVKDFYPPFNDVSQIPHADSSESIRIVLEKMFEKESSEERDIWIGPEPGVQP